MLPHPKYKFSITGYSVPIGYRWLNFDEKVQSGDYYIDWTTTRLYIDIANHDEIGHSRGTGNNKSFGFIRKIV